MFNRIVSDAKQNLELFNCLQIKLFMGNTWNRLIIYKIELLVLPIYTWNHLTVRKRMNSVEKNNKCLIAILYSTLLWTNKWLILDRNIVLDHNN